MAYNYKQYNKLIKFDKTFKRAKRGLSYATYLDQVSVLDIKVSKSVIIQWAFRMNDMNFQGFSIDDLDEFLQGISYFFCEDKPFYIPVYVPDLAYLYHFLVKKYGKDAIKDLYSVKGDIAYLRLYNIEFRCLGVFLDLNDDKLFEELNEESKNIFRRVHYMVDLLSKILSLYTNYTIANLPLTQIRFVRDEMTKYKSNSFDINYNPLKILDIDEYRILRYAPAGGLCSFSPDYLDKHLSNVYCFDFKSAFPAVMFKYKLFPMKYLGYKKHLNSNIYLDYCNKYYAVLAKVTIKNLEKKKGHPGFKDDCIVLDENSSSSHRRYNVFTNDLDEIISADKVELYLTDIDFLILKNHYKGVILYAEDVYVYERGYLPNSLVKCVCEFFRKKNHSEIEIERLINKKATNSIYGLNKLDPIREYVDFDGGYLPDTPPDPDELIKKYNDNIESGKAYSCFHWGVYIAAIQRYVLSNIIVKAIELGCWAYSDTDSVYSPYNKEFIELVKNYNKRHIATMKHLQKTIRRNIYIGDDDNNILGGFYLDKVCENFKVLWKKQYMYTENGELNVTMSGIDKKRAKKVIDKLDNPFEEIKKGYKLKGVMKGYLETETGVKTIYRTVELGGSK